MHDVILRKVLESAEWKVRAQKLKVSTNVNMYHTHGTMYSDTGITFKAVREDILYFSTQFQIRMRDLASCCGILEINRPFGQSLSQPKFDFYMDLVMEILRRAAFPSKSERLYFPEIWGNTLIASTSSESDPKLCVWLESRGWKNCGTAKNPHTNHNVTTWWMGLGKNGPMVPTIPTVKPRVRRTKVLEDYA